MKECKVFISHKHLDEEGNLTQDYYIAQQLYAELRVRGVSAFFSDRTIFQMGQSDFKKLIDHALDLAQILVVVGTRKEYISSEWVKYEYETFHIDILNGKKQDANIMSYTNNISTEELPRTLSGRQNFSVISMSCERVADYIVNALNKGEIVERNVHIDRGIQLENKELKFANTLDYFEKNMKDISEIESVEMAFHVGAEWHRDNRYYDLLHELVNNKIKINILINSPAAANILAKHMRHEGTRDEYMSFKKGLSKWQKFEEKYPELVKVRVVKVPVLRCYHSFHMKEEAKDTVHVRHYTYSNYRTDKNLQHWFARNSEYFELYRNEYEYLWELAEPTKEK